MRNIMIKEIKLSSHILSYLFILFGFMFFLPGYPILCGVFFITLGIFQSFQCARENNDIIYSTLLPIAKHDVVKGKFCFVCFIEMCGLLLMSTIVILRMTVLNNLPAYRNNALMNANCFSLGLAFLIFGLFNLQFVGGFFKTAYRIGRPFVIYIIFAFIIIFIGEALHHIPGLQFLNAFGSDYLTFQLLLLGFGILIFFALTGISYSKSCKRFELLDL